MIWYAAFVILAALGLAVGTSDTWVPVRVEEHEDADPHR
jgi:uncharacterized Ntn-hydrolase superfamily protein